MLRGLLKVLAVAVVFLATLAIGAFAILSLMPLDAAAVVRASNAGRPAATHEEALAAFASVEAGEAALALHQRCRSTLLDHGTKTARAVVFFHGLTNCPAQGDQLAAELFARGYNVYLPRLPGHGEANRLTTALANVTAEDFAAAAGAAIDLAEGLGEEVVVVGISAGGAMAAWLAQSREDVGRAIAVSPYLGPSNLPPWSMRAVANLVRVLPNMMMWWNPDDPLAVSDMDYAYPRYATRAMAEVMRLGEIVETAAAEGAPKVRRLGVLISEADDTASRPLVDELVSSWREHGREVEVEVLPLDRGIPHDLIDPRQDAADIAFVYPILISMIEAPN
jgi:esterase/lipase